MKTVRCAIYTRKSSDEGLEQGFNSLDAQREACAAYILSQASEGWSALPDLYDDGGISGGTLERPALKRLLADVAAGKVDVIVVYKVDRLSRSLFDFAKLVEIFEKAGTSFVSITQSFNTTSSMGRLTLNMLLSFAQFEREVTAERIRDKIAASKAKGMWMGGNAPIGYAPNGRSLAIVEQDADLVRMIFRRYLEVGTVYELQEQLLHEAVLTPKRMTTTGRQMGAVPFARTQIYKILSNPLYLGVIPHQGKTYPGLHAAIIDQDLWDRVQARLAANLQGRRRGRAGERSALLAGKITDEADRALISTHASKVARSGQGRVRYGYYISQRQPGAESKNGWRIPARELDVVVTNVVAGALADPLDLIERAGLDVRARGFDAMVDRLAMLAARVRARDHIVVRELVSRVRVFADAVEVECNAQAIAAAIDARLEGDKLWILRQPVSLTRSGMAMRLIHGGKGMLEDPDPALLRIIVRARGYWLELRRGVLSISQLADREKISPAYITRVLRLAFLSPSIIDAIVAGRQPAALTARRLVATDAIDGDWRTQALSLLAASRA